MPYDDSSQINIDDDVSKDLELLQLTGRQQLLPWQRFINQLPALQTIADGQRQSTSPRGPLELMSEELIRQAAVGNLQLVYKLVTSDQCNVDVCDVNGYTALMAATVMS